MKGQILGIAAGLALMVGLLLVAHAAQAQAIKTPISGEQTGCRPAASQPDRKIWTDEDGVRHVRNHEQRCWIAGDIVGRTVEWNDSNVDAAAGQVDAHGYAVFTGELLGEPTTAVIRWVSECSPKGNTISCQEDDVWHFDNGSKANLVIIFERGSGPPLPYVGILVDPPGRD